MKQLPSRLRRLDDALADLPLDEPMLLSELDGFLTGVLVCPQTIATADWLPIVWGSGSGAPFDDPLDVQWFTDAVTARYSEIARDLGRGKPQPLFDIDERNGDILWEVWIDGFAQAMALRSTAWAALARGGDVEAIDALNRLSILIAIDRNESSLDSVEINALHDTAPAEIAINIMRLHAARARRGDLLPLPTSRTRSVRPGRNDPCPCGSGKKFKRCCG